MAAAARRIGVSAQSCFTPDVFVVTGERCKCISAGEHTETKSLGNTGLWIFFKRMSGDWTVLTSLMQLAIWMCRRRPQAWAMAIAPLQLKGRSQLMPVGAVSAEIAAGSVCSSGAGSRYAANKLPASLPSALLALTCSDGLGINHLCIPYELCESQ
ncbi:psbL [Symbiodinium microadriaticum]|nr:psbL [Symbiodinium microadriaticum]